MARAELLQKTKEKRIYSWKTQSINVYLIYAKKEVTQFTAFPPFQVFRQVLFETLTKTQSEYLSEFSKLNSHERELVLAYIRGINDSKSGKRRGR